MRTALVIRRMIRKPLSLWSNYAPLHARPEETRFELLDENGKGVGEFAFTSIEFKMLALLKVALTTPWGEASIVPLESGNAITLNGTELATVGGSVFRKGFSLTFPVGRTLKFDHLASGKNDVQYSEGSGRIIGVEERGTLAEGEPSRSIQLTREEIKMLPKADRPRSIETRNYKQFRILTSGTFP